MRLLALCTTALMLAAPPGLAQPAEMPHRLIEHLGVQMRLASEGRQQTPAAELERAAAAAIRTWARSRPGDDALHDGDALGRTPLMLAVSGGHAPVVDALLEDPIVRARIHTRNRAGETAWMIAATAPALTLAACHPGVLTIERQPLLYPYAQRMAALHAKDNATVLGILQALQRAGARAEPEAARTAWLTRCRDALPETRARIAAGRVPEDLFDEAVQRVIAYNQAARTAAATLPLRPPAGMRFTPVDPAGLALATPRLDQLRCASRPAPALRDLAWSGAMTVHARAVSRAGIVEAVDLNVMPAGANPLIADYFRKLVIQALAAYRCEGDFVFVQAFDFRFD